MKAYAVQRGLAHWLVQRVTAIFMAIYTLGAIGSILLSIPLTYEDWKAILENPVARVATTLFAVCAAWHAAIGIEDVLRDYARNDTVRRLLLGACYVVLASFAVRLSLALWR